MNDEYVLEIKSIETLDEQMLSVKAEGVISGFGKLLLAIKALEALQIDDYMTPLLFRMYLKRDEMPQTVVDLSKMPRKEDE